MSLRCHVCGFENDDNNTSCSECGVSIDQNSPFNSNGTPADRSEEVMDNYEPSSSEEPESAPVQDEESPESTQIVAVPDSTPAVVASSDAVVSDEDLIAEAAGDLALSSCPSCSADIDEEDFYCSICGVNLRNYVAAEDLIKAATNSVPVTEPGGKPTFKLSVVTGHDQGTVHTIMRSEALLGRALDNDIVLSSDGYTSGRHSRVFKEDDSFFVEDLGSTNGTFVRVKGKVSIKPGDEIKIGQSIFRLEEIQD